MKVKIDAWAWLPKDELSLVQLQALRSALTIYPKKVGDHPGDAPGPLELFVEEEHRIGVPREYFLSTKQLNHEITYDVSEGDKERWGGPLEFAGTLRPEQENAVSSVVQKLRTNYLGGILKAVPGWGKTVAGCALIARLQVPTLVIVHKAFLVDQWQERIEQFLPGAKVGRAQQDECDFVGKHIVIGMVHSLAARDYGKIFADWPGLLLVDECHRIGAETWAPVPTKFRARWRVGVSGTPRRKDGADNVFLYHLGPLLYISKETRMTPKIRRVPTDFHLVKTERFNPKLANKSLLLRFLCASIPRNKLINERLIMALEAGRKVLVLSERIAHLQSMEALLRETWPKSKGPMPSVGYYIGGRTEEQLERAAEAQCIFATSQFAAEGLDIPALDTLFLTTPMADVEQAIGRILRPCEGKKDPIVVDFRDDKVSQFRKYGEMRDRLYGRVA